MIANSIEARRQAGARLGLHSSNLTPPCSPEPSFIAKSTSEGLATPRSTSLRAIGQGLVVSRRIRIQTLGRICECGNAARGQKKVGIRQQRAAFSAATAVNVRVSPRQAPDTGGEAATDMFVALSHLLLDRLHTLWLPCT